LKQTELFSVAQPSAKEQCKVKAIVQKVIAPRSSPYDPITILNSGIHPAENNE
jgi:hypothetical protein